MPAVKQKRPEIAVPTHFIDQYIVDLAERYRAHYGHYSAICRYTGTPPRYVSQLVQDTLEHNWTVESLKQMEVALNAWEALPPDAQQRLIAGYAKGNNRRAMTALAETLTQYPAQV